MIQTKVVREPINDIPLPVLVGKRKRVQLVCPEGSSMTKQSFKDECDINSILKRYESTGMITHVNERTAMYGDVSHIPDYQSALNIVMHAEDSFMSMPADVRKRFNNDPGLMIEFLGDSKNFDEAVKLGLVEKPKTPPPEVVTPPGGALTPPL